MHAAARAARRAVFVSVVVVTALAASSAAAAASVPLPAGTLRAPIARFDFAVYHLSKPTRPAADRARALLARAGFSVVATLPATGAPPSALVRALAVADMPPPNLRTLRFRGRTLDDADKERLQHPDSITLVRFAVPGADAPRRYRAAAGAVRALAAETDGLVYDVAARRIVTPARLGEVLAKWTGDVPDLYAEITIDTYRDGELIRLVSLGMEKLGLPDLEVRDVAAHDTPSMSTLMVVTLQTMVERGSLARAGALDLALDGLRNRAKTGDPPGLIRKNATRRATVALVAAEREEGDADNRLVALDFPGPPATLQVRHNELLTRLFGSEEHVAYAEADDAELSAARRRARAALLKLKPRFASAAHELDHLLVKAPFTTTHGGTEWMWVEVVRWQGTKIHGLLENDPDDVPALKAGQAVDVDEASLFDYLLRHTDGTSEGNETGRILDARESAGAR